MNILIYSWRDMRHPQAGGAEVYLHEQSRFWIERGARIQWISSHFSGAPHHETIDGIEIFRCGGKYSVYLNAFFKSSRCCKPDIIIDAENGIPFFTPIYATAPVVLLIHHMHTDVWMREYTWPLATIGAVLEQRAMPRIYRNRRIVTVSESSREMIAELFPSALIELVPNAISPALAPGRKGDRPVALFIGRLKRYKSIETILLAADRLRGTDIVFNIAGRGDDEKRLRQICESLRLDTVNFLGYVSEDRKRELLQEAWMLINPSSMEGWGIANVEAAACGTPAIGSDVPGIRDSIINGKTGLLFEYENSAELAGKVKGLLEDSAERERLARGGIEWAARFSWEQSAGSMYAILKAEIEEFNREKNIDES